ncbi:MAG: hypothetical protein V8S96_07400 [Lachnospiraceae bacterium]
MTGTAVCVVKNSGAVFTMFKIADSRVVEDGDELEITITTRNTSFDELYLGENDEENKTPVIREQNLRMVDGASPSAYRRARRVRFCRSSQKRRTEAGTQTRISGSIFLRAQPNHSHRRNEIRLQRAEQELPPRS